MKIDQFSTARLIKGQLSLLSQLREMYPAILMEMELGEAGPPGAIYSVPRSSPAHVTSRKVLQQLLRRQGDAYTVVAPCLHLGKCGKCHPGAIFEARNLRRARPERPILEGGSYPAAWP